MSDKPELQPPSLPRTFASDPNASRFKPVAMIGFAVLAVGALAVVMILPDQLATRRDRVQVTPNIDPEAKKADQSTSNAMEAQALLQQLLTRQVRLETEGIRTWGAQPLMTSYQEVLTLRSEADAYLDDRVFDQAAKGYREAIAKLDQLAENRPERLRRALQAGHDAYAQLDSQSAKHHYEIALAADSGNREAQIGIRRAETLPKILEHMAQGQIHEGNGKLDLAWKRYHDAASLDKDFQPAQEHLQRNVELIQERDVRHSMSAAIAALHRNDLIQAARELDVVRKLRPNAEGFRDLEQQLKNAQQLAELQQLRGEASRYEQTEQWKKALLAYIKALNIDPNASFAQEGKWRTKQFLDLSQQVRHYLSHPDDLQTPEHRNHARRMVDQAFAKSDIGPTFRDQTEKLRHLLDQYNKPISILVHSDGLTHVRINRVGSLGLFLEHRLTLHPGRYKAVGSRSGYRDVSIRFTVPVASEEITLTVYCEEAI